MVNKIRQYQILALEEADPYAHVCYSQRNSFWQPAICKMTRYSRLPLALCPARRETGNASTQPSSADRTKPGNDHRTSQSQLTKERGTPGPAALFELSLIRPHAITNIALAYTIPPPFIPTHASFVQLTAAQDGTRGHTNCRHCA